MSKPTPCQMLIECKSTPRSGLHYLKQAFQTRLGENFSFCERYNEPGCCKQFPCALTCFRDAAKSSKQSYLRFTKSHDFDLSDKKLKTSKDIRVLILKRDPLFVITSWWELQEIQRHRSLLSKHHINPSKIFYLHEAPLINQSIDLIDQHYISIENGIFELWLDHATSYIKGFHRKWIDTDDRPFTYKVDYDDIQSFANNILNELNPSTTQSTLGSKIFTPRKDPFMVKSKAISEQLQNKREFILDTLQKKELVI